MNEAEPSVHWHCSTSVPDIALNCEISEFELEAEAGFQPPESLLFSLVLNRGVARGSSGLPLPLTFFTYAESDSGYLLTSDHPYVSGNYFTRAIYLLIIDSTSGAVEVRDIGGRTNGSGECTPVED